MSLLLLASPLLLLWLQGRWVRMRTPRLPDASGPVSGLVNGSRRQSFRLLVVGESTVAGIGAPDHESALTGQIAQALASRWPDCGIHWQAMGKSGATAHDLLALDPPDSDAIVIALGVNDVLRLRRSSQFADDIAKLIELLRKGTQTPVVLAGVPPMGEFPALPQPLRAILGWRASRLEAAVRRLEVIHCGALAGTDPALFARDGFHPSPRGYTLWASEIANLIPPL